MKKKEGERGLLQFEAIYIAEIMSTAKYLNRRYKENQLVNIVKSHESNQPNMNSTVKASAKVSNENSGGREEKTKKAYNT